MNFSREELLLADMARSNIKVGNFYDMFHAIQTAGHEYFSALFDLGMIGNGYIPDERRWSLESSVLCECRASNLPGFILGAILK